MAKQQSDTLNKILGKVVSIEGTIQGKMVTKDEFQEFKNGIYSHIDGFIKLHGTLDQELVSLRNKYDRLEHRLSKVEQKLGR